MGKLEIWNTAASHISNQRLENVDQEGPLGDAFRDLWPAIYEQLLSYSRWDFATRREVLGPRIVQAGIVPAGWAGEQLISLPERFRQIPYRWVVELTYQDEIGREQTASLIAGAGPDGDFVASGSPLTAPVDRLPVELTVLPTLNAPSRVTPLQQDRRIELVWARVPGASDYNVRWRRGAAGDWTTIIGTNGFTEYDFDGLENGVLYQFQVMARSTQGISRWSGAANGIPVGPPSEQQLAPPIPVGLVGASLNGAARMTWREVATATGYHLRWRLAGEWNNPVTSPNGDRGEMTITMLANGNEYEVQVRAFNLYGRSDWSNSAFVSPAAQVPIIPIGLELEPLNGRMQFSFLRSAGAIDYDVRYKRNTDTVWTMIEDTSITHPASAEGDPDFRVAIIISPLMNGVEYQFAVRAGNANGYSLYSGHVSGSPQASRTPTITDLDPTPGDAEVTLRHGTVQGATNYRYRWRQALPGEDWTEVSQDGTALMHTITGLDNDVRHEFQVRAEKPEAEGGDGLWSSSATATPEAALEPPGATSLRCVAGDSQAELIWISADRADFYQFRQATTIGEWGDWMYAGAAGSTRRPITMLQNGTPYYFQVRGVNDASVPFGPESNTCDAEPAPVGEAPNVPERIRCQGQQSAVSITWDGDERATDYAGEYQLLDDASQPVGVPTPFLSGDEDTAESTRVPGLSNDRTYQLRLKAINMFGESNWSDWVNCTPMPGLPSASQMQDPVCGNATVSLSWDSVADIATYQVYRSTNSGSPPAGDAKRAGDSRFDDLASTQYTDNAAQNGTLYYYWVRGVNSSGEGPWSNPVSCTPVAPLTVPPLPGNFGVVNGNANAVATWDDVAGETGYQIAYNTTGTKPLNVDEPVGVIIISVAEDAATRTIENLSNGSTYYFWLRSLNMDVFSDWSGAESATPEAPPPPPSRPNLQLDECGDAQIQLGWNNVTGADSYQLYKSTSSSTPGDDPSGLITRSSSSYTDTNVVNGTTYYYWVRARGPGGNSAWSNRVSCRPMAILPPPVPSLAVDLCGDARIELDWSNVTGADSYQLYKSTSPSTPGDDPSGLITRSSSSYTDTSVVNGTTYYYWVRARGPGGNSAWSNRVSCRPSAPLQVPSIRVTVDPTITLRVSRALLELGSVTGAIRYRTEYRIGTFGPYRSFGVGSSLSYALSISTTAGNTIQFRARSETNTDESLWNVATYLVPNAPSAGPSLTLSVDRNNPRPGVARTQIGINVVPRATWYEVQRASPMSTEEPGEGEWMGLHFSQETNLVSTFTLAATHVFQWRARGWSPGGPGPWGARRTFTV